MLHCTIFENDDNAVNSQRPINLSLWNENVKFVYMDNYQRTVLENIPNINDIIKLKRYESILQPGRWKKMLQRF